MPFDPAAPFEIEQSKTTGFAPSEPFAYERLPGAEPPEPPAAPQRSFASDYAKVTPPPENYAKTVEEAAARYGVPLQIAHWVGSRESGWNPQAVGIPTKSGQAKGAWQFMDATAKEMGLADPFNFDASTDAAMRYIRKLYEDNGNNWEDAVAKYGTFSTGKGADADAAVRRGFRDYMAGNASTWRDVLRGAARGMVSGAANVAGLPSDAMNFADQAWQYLMATGAEKLGLLTPEQAEDLRKQLDGEDYEWTSDKIKDKLLRAAGYFGADTTPPVTRTGRIAEAATSFAPIGAMGARAAREVPAAIGWYGALPGVTSEAAGQATEGTPLEKPARLLGAVAGAAPGVAMDVLRGGPRMVAEMLDSMTPQQNAAVEGLLAEARAAGAPLTLPEAVQHVTNGATTLGDVQRVVEQTRTGAPIMRQFYAERPGQNEALARSTFDQIAPSAPVPAEIAPRVQGAAERALQAERDATNALSRPAYEATANNPAALVPERAFAAVRDHPAIEQALGAVRKDPVKYGDLRGLPDNSMPVLDAAKKYLDDVAEASKRAGENFGAANASRASDDLLALMDQSFPRYASARNIQSIRQRYVEEPLGRSPTGQLAEATVFDKQAAILFNRRPVPGSETAVADAVKTVAKLDPDAAKGMVRLYLEQQFDEAAQKLQSGPNQAGGAKFAAVVMGNPQQAKNMEAALRALPDGDVRWNAFKKAQKLFEAQGRRQNMGSPTAFNQSMIDREMSEGTKVGTLLATAGSPGRWASFFGDLYREFRIGRNAAQLARVFTEGNVADLRALARAPSGSIQAQAALAVAVGKRLVPVGEPRPPSEPKP